MTAAGISREIPHGAPPSNARRIKEELKRHARTHNNF